jgi:lipopolysaccharide assembly outer membrane protein LptD (OstA)
LGTNPYWLINGNRNDDTRNRIQGFAKATYQITNNWSIFARIGTDYVPIRILKVYTVMAIGMLTEAHSASEISVTQETNADVLLMYNGKLTEDIGLKFNVGGNRMLATRSSQGVNGQDFQDPNKQQPLPVQILPIHSITK